MPRLFTRLPWLLFPSVKPGNALVWVIDPEPNLCDSVGWLARSHCGVSRLEMFHSQQTALARLEGEISKPLVIITDFRGDFRINGGEFIARARRLCPARTRFILFSGVVSDEAQFLQACRDPETRPDAIVPKPDIAMLTEVLDRMLAGRQAGQ